MPYGQIHYKGVNVIAFKELTEEDIKNILYRLRTEKSSKVVSYIQEKYGTKQRTAYNWIAKLIESEENKEFKTTLSGKLCGPMYVKGTTTLVDGDGVAKLQWIKEDAKKNMEATKFMEAMEMFIDKMDTVRSPVVLDDIIFRDSLMVKYPIADAHLGLLTYKDQVGVCWGLEEAVDAFKTGVKLLMDRAPNCGVGLILDLGDMVHVADSTGKTRGHGHVLDVDGSLAEIYEAAIEVIVSMIDEALKHHKIVVFRKTIGNHDGDTSLALGVFLKRLYKNEPRVVIEADSNLFWWYHFGNSLHFSTHGHTVKQKDLPEIIASDCKDIWSGAKYVYADTGHVHHQEVLETRTVKCESHNSLVPGDSYNYGSGYRSGRLLKSIIYDDTYGEIGRSIVNMEMIYAKLRN